MECLAFQNLDPVFFARSAFLHILHSPPTFSHMRTCLPVHLLADIQVENSMFWVVVVGGGGCTCANGLMIAIEQCLRIAMPYSLLVSGRFRDFFFI